MPTEAGRKAARMAVQRELARTGGDGAALGRKSGVHPQTVQAFIRGERWPALKTLGRLDAALGWPVGTLSAIAEGGYPDGVADLDPGAQTVGGGVDDDDALLFARPDGLTDEEWEAAKVSAGELVRWVFEKARERPKQR